MSKHTPGPWTWGGQADDNEYAVHIGKFRLVELRYSGDTTSEAVANARLISAAPELLAVLKELEESAGYWSEYDITLGIVDRIRAALAKAEA